MIKRIISVLLLVLLVIIGAAFGYRSIQQKQALKKSEDLIVKGGVSVVEEIDLGGVKQYILIEGAKKNSPVILFLHGGPGYPLPFGVSARSLFPTISNNFTAVYWDQRGAGKSYDKTIDPKTINIEQFILDTNDLVDYLIAHLNEEKIFLVGISWGSIIGLEMIHRYPEKFYAYIGNGQVVSHSEGLQIGFDWLLQKAEKSNDKQLAKAVGKIGLPPFTVEQSEVIDDLLMKEGGFTYESDQVKKASIWGEVKGAFLSPDYTLGDIYSVIKSGYKFSNSDKIINEMIAIDFRSTITSVDIPVYFIQGKYDMVCPLALVEEYYNSLISPKGKELTLLEQSAHTLNEHDLNQFLDVHLKRIITNNWHKNNRESWGNI